MSKENVNPTDENEDPILSPFEEMMMSIMGASDEQIEQTKSLIRRDKKILVKMGNEGPITLYEFVTKHTEGMSNEQIENIRQLEVGHVIEVPELNCDLTRVE